MHSFATYLTNESSDGTHFDSKLGSERNEPEFSEFDSSSVQIT